MYSLSVAVGPTVWMLLFNNEKNAKTQEACLKTALDTQVVGALKDDFGQTLQVVPGSLHGWVFEDMDATKMAHCERMLHSARVQGQAQRMAESDPALRMGMQTRSPQMISPFGPNGRP